MIRSHATPPLTLLLLTLACGGPKTPPPEGDPTIPVRVVRPAARSTEPAMVLTGLLGAKEEIPLSFKVGGIVATVAADAGDVVRAGHLLAGLSLTEIEAAVAAAREGREKARRDLARVERLARDSVATQAQLEDARTASTVAESQLRVAEFTRQYAEVRAPNDGVVLRRQLEVGQQVAPGVPVFVLRTERSGLVLRAGASDREAVRLSEGMRATVRMDAHPGVTFDGRITRIGVAASPMTGTYEVEIAVSPGTRRLATGLVAQAQIVTRAARGVLTIPTESLQEVEGRAASIFVLQDGTTVRRIPLEVLWIDGGVAAVAGAIDSTTAVITAGATRLTDGARVRVIDERAP
ncbi:MAG: efflux RND transporter periplasmic adaptor subunit [Gemmatimonadota bacterium]